MTASFEGLPAMALHEGPVAFEDLTTRARIRDLNSTVSTVKMSQASR
jgi:hypothetical protein